MENRQLAKIFTDDEGQIFEQVEELNEELRELSDAKRKLALLKDVRMDFCKVHIFIEQIIVCSWQQSAFVLGEF
ncbi:unnamed protein product [Dibothriocephalus latus]|uniref:Uncharacterized protein n=1 Tax=Dibothriocephalus latus TaxID=60516 RepID=A0A3P7LV44_DIBLA|nr:unnamed protein product [Dibothriocephalus latus]